MTTAGIVWVSTVEVRSLDSGGGGEEKRAQSLEKSYSRGIDLCTVKITVDLLVSTISSVDIEGENIARECPEGIEKEAIFMLRTSVEFFFFFFF